MKGIEQLIKRTERVLAVLSNEEQLTQVIGIVAGKELEANIGRRIFLQGRDVANSAIGSYSTKPIYINPNNRLFELLPKFKKKKPRLKPVGKNGESLFKNGKPKKTAYIAGGYAEFRKIVGRQPGAKLQKVGGITTNGVNLNLTGSMAQNFSLGISGTRIGMGFNSAVEFAKARGLEKRFGKSIFAASPQERKAFRDAMNREIQRIITEVLKK